MIQIIKNLLAEITINKKNKNKLKEIINKYRILIQAKNSRYKKIAESYLNDIEEDINNNIEINIDSSSNDEYLENYFISKRQAEIYNRLIDKDIYLELISLLKEKKLNKSKINEKNKKLIENFNKYYKLLSANKIAKNLLIFNTIKKENNYEYYYRLGALYNNYQMHEEIKTINQIINKINILNSNVYNYWIQNLKNNSFNYKYLHFKKTWENYEIWDMVIDSSIVNYRTWLAKFEYKIALKKIKKIDYN